MPRFRLKTIFIAFAILAFVLAMIYPAVFRVQEDARCCGCCGKTTQIVLAMLNYESAHMELPVGIEMDATGRPYQSWRALAGAYMESSPYYYDPAFAWDASKNKRLVDGTPIALADNFGGNRRVAPLDPCSAWWRCPSCERHSKQVNYAVVVGEETAFPLNRAVKLEEITDGLENTILVVETLSGSPFWTEPKDLQFDTMSFTIDNFSNDGLSSYHPNGANVCFADGAAFFVTKAISPNELRALLTIAGGEAVTRQELLDRGVIR